MPATARRRGADGEHQQEGAADVDAEDAHHGGVLDAGAHHQADRGTIQHEIKRQKYKAR